MFFILICVKLSFTNKIKYHSLKKNSTGDLGGIYLGVDKIVFFGYFNDPPSLSNTAFVRFEFPALFLAGTHGSCFCY